MGLCTTHNWGSDQEYVLTSELDKVANAAKQVVAFCRPHLPAGSASNDVCSAVEVSVAEVLTNIIRHAYGGVSGLPIQVMVVADERRVEIHVFDLGSEMPAEAIAPPALEFDPGDIAGLPVGGFGWTLINREMDQIRYHREDGVNHLEIVKHVHL